MHPLPPLRLRPRARLLALAASLLLQAGCSMSASRAARTAPPPAPAPPLNQTFEIACHNCYEAERFPKLTDALDGIVGGIEIDFFDTSTYTLGERRPGAWYVRHDPGPPLTGPVKPNENNCTSRGGDAGNDLEACLADIGRWLDADSTRPLLTVFLDKKQSWSREDEGRRPTDLDKLVTRTIPRHRIFTPADMASGEYVTRGTVRSFASARAAARQGRWPGTDALRGKVLFVLTGGGLQASTEANRTLHAYVMERRGDAVAFVAPDLPNKAQVKEAPPGFDERTGEWVVFYNLAYGYRVHEAGPLIHRSGYVSRAWWAAERDDDDLCRVRDRYRIHRIARYTPRPLQCAEGGTGTTPPR